MREVKERKELRKRNKAQMEKGKRDRWKEMEKIMEDRGVGGRGGERKPWKSPGARESIEKHPMSLEEGEA